ncbi:M1 family metallopeptidase [Pseudoalteromonas sp. MMG013]|uniref:M1 family metallopeptidase n=1 Tax=Pseudoalteromonas sp. MMG013 TaxID=2822687 RepID=UPI001B38FD4A|nr:M1 family metallopeptidase [Pseudoalteromonas sp. MMG013]MBQ4862480.1 M1 family metallopeptidase [Pseudoalteromonas sp. MMG013]
MSSRYVLFTLFYIAALLIKLEHVEAAEYKLGHYVTPEQQKIVLHLNPNIDEYRGTTEISVHVKEAVSAIKLYSKKLNIRRATLTLDAEKPIGLAASKANKYDIIELTAQQKIERGRYLLSVQFSGNYNRDMTGLYQFYDQGHYLATQFQAMQARTVFPSFDEPEFKISFQITIIAPSDFDVISSTPIEFIDEKNGYITHHFKETRPINTDVIAFSVGKFKSLTIKGLPVSSVIYTTQGADNHYEHVARVIPKLFNYIQSYFSIQFPYQKLDFLVLPAYEGAGMENVGLVTLNKTWITSPNEVSKSKRYALYKLLAHEIIHMWFGNLVTMRWWDDLWLNESFSEWLARKMVTTHYAEFENNLDLPQLESFWDDTPTSRPIKRTMRTVDDYHSIGQVVYTKGSSVIAMVEQYVGERAFRLAVISYIKQFYGGNVSYSEFIAHIEAHAKRPVADIFDSFLKQPSYPFVSVTRKNNQLIITQRPFTESGSEPVRELSSTNKAPYWHIPLQLKFFTHHGVIIQPVLLNETELTVPLPKGTFAVFPDAYGLGYYRYTSYFDDTVSDAGNETWINLLSDIEKQSLMANNQALVRGGYRSYADALTLQLQMITNKSVNQELVVEGLRALNNDFYDVVPPRLYEPNASYIIEKLSPILNARRWYRDNSDASANSELKSISLIFLGAKLRDNDAINFAKTHYQAILTRQSQLDIELQNAVLNVIASTSGKKELNQFMATYKTSKNEALKKRLIRYMGYFSFEGAVQMYYAFLFSKDVRKEAFKGYYLQYPIYNPKNRTSAINYLEKNINKLFEKSSPEEQQWQPYSFATVCSIELKDRINKLFSSYIDKIDGLKSKLANVNHMITQCDVAQKAQYERLVDLLSVKEN